MLQSSCRLPPRPVGSGSARGSRRFDVPSTPGEIWLASRSALAHLSAHARRRPSAGAGSFTGSAAADPHADPAISSSARKALYGSYGSLTVWGNAYVPKGRRLIVRGNLKVARGVCLDAFTLTVAGSVVFSRNASIQDPDSNEVQTNTIGGNLICWGNSPAAQINPQDGASRTPSQDARSDSAPACDTARGPVTVSTRKLGGARLPACSPRLAGAHRYESTRRTPAFYPWDGSRSTQAAPRVSTRKSPALLVTRSRLRNPTASSARCERSSQLRASDVWAPGRLGHPRHGCLVAEAASGSRVR